MSRLAWKALLAGVVAVGFAQAAAAQSVSGLVHRSGNSFHIAVCPEHGANAEVRCHSQVVTDIQGNILYDPNAQAHAVPSGLGAGDLRLAYKAPAPAGQPGTGPTIAIVDAYGDSSAESDLGVYRSQYGLGTCSTQNGCFKKVNQNGVQGGYPRDNTGWSQETAIDLAMASAMCPSCKILLVEANSASFADLGAAENRAAAMGAHAISNSYGANETNGVASLEPYYTHPGVAITVSSGDNGYGVSYPASSPKVTAVGGTSLKRDSSARGWSETVWSGAGSGCSNQFAKPAWQTNVTDGNCPNNRMVADVSAVADPSTGIAVYGPVFGHIRGWMVFGGTSVAAPLIAGLYGANGGPASAGSDPYNHRANLFDVTSGSNGNCGGLYLCTGQVGYDGPSGLGTPNGAAAFGK